MTLALVACSPVTLTSWTSPKAGEFKVQKVVVWALFDKLENEKPFEDYLCDYLRTKGVGAIPALSLIKPSTKYTREELATIFKEAGANCALLFTYKGTDTTETYVPPTTTLYPEVYYNYYSYYNYSYPAYWGSGGAVATPGYWVTSSTINLVANLYTHSDEGLVYSASIQITDPRDVKSAALEVAKKVWSDWVRVKTASRKK